MTFNQSAASFLRLLLPLVIACGLLSTSPALADSPEKILLWPDGAPGAKGDTPNDKPTLTVCLPEKEKATGTAVVVCPGGGYGGLALGHEGVVIAEWFNQMGVAAVILEYRHRGKGYGHPAPLQDAQRAIRTVRAKADAWNIDSAKIGIMGFSAGGHLASTAGTHFDAGDAAATDPIQRVSCRPDFMILCYAVIALNEPFTHFGSQRNLLGEDADPELIRSLSNEKQVTPETPPTFLFHTDQDTGVPAENSIYFYLALREAKVPAELHVFRTGGHGVGLGANIPGTSNWPNCCKAWLAGRGLLDAKR
ncbi:MAG TPA: alpha/beta hydrolase [Thermoguttaceae bacterium]|nr:alpha/beta hydrolase [Thermoguttaceae bacterium]